MARVLLAFALVVASLALPATAQDRVLGIEVVKEDVPVQEIFGRLLEYPFTQAEVDLFLAAVEKVEPWARAHPDAWTALNDEDEVHLVTKLRALGVWKEAGVEVAPEEFFALLVKISTAKDLAGEDLAAKRKELAAQVRQLEGLLKTQPEQAAEIREALDVVRALDRALDNYPRRNFDLYRANREAIDRAVDRLNAIEGEEGR